MSAELFAAQGGELCRSPDLVVRLGGELYPWALAMPAVLGSLAFGGKWEALVKAQGPGLPAGKADLQPPRKVSDISDGSCRNFRVLEVCRMDLELGSRWPRSFTCFGVTCPTIKFCACCLLRVPDRGRSRLQSWRLWLFGSRKADVAGPGAASDLQGGTPPTAGASPTAPLDADLPPRRAVSAGGASLNLSAGGASLPGDSPDFPEEVLAKKQRAAIAKTLNPSSEQLASLRLKEGQNTVVFSTGSGREVRCYCYLLRWDTRLVVSDIDGTITKSDLLGHVLPAIGVDWSHAGVTQLFTNIVANGYQVGGWARRRGRGRPGVLEGRSIMRQCDLLDLLHLTQSD